MHVMKRRMIVCVGLAIIVLSGITWFSYAAHNVTLSEDVLSKRVIKCIEDSGNNCITAKSLNNDLWEEVWIISPYAEVERFGGIFPLRVKRAVNRTGIEYREDLCVFVFVLNNGDCQICVEERYPVDFVNCSSDGFMKCTPDAVMCFAETGELRPRLVLDTIIQGCTTGKSW